MPVSLKDIKAGQEPPASRKIREFLSKNAKPEAPYFSNEELMTKLSFGDGHIRTMGRSWLKDWNKRVGRFVYWSTPEHIKKL